MTEINYDRLNEQAKQLHDHAFADGKRQAEQERETYFARRIADDNLAIAKGLLELAEAYASGQNLDTAMRITAQARRVVGKTPAIHIPHALSANLERARRHANPSNGEGFDVAALRDAVASLSEVPA